VGVAIDCGDVGPVARFYERLLGFELGDFEPPRWAQLWDPAGGVHLNIQEEDWYEPPTWPEQPGAQAKMLHFEVEVEDLEAAVTTAIEAGGTEAPWQPPDRRPDRIRIVLDPAGHPLCGAPCPTTSTFCSRAMPRTGLCRVQPEPSICTPGRRAIGGVRFR
jgi:catechol 2,3-dioxygenase-like lactoylglutathione lyase family enzyme